MCESFADVGFSLFSSTNADRAERLNCQFSDKPSKSAISPLEQCAQYSWTNTYRFVSDPAATSTGNDYGLGLLSSISHLNGIGKVTLAQEFVACFRQDERYESVFWINVEDWGTCFKQALGSIGYQSKPSGDSKLGSPDIDVDVSVPTKEDKPCDERMEHKGGCYWTNGKVGSGKSLLMKYISQDVRSHMSRVDGLFSNHEDKCSDLMESKAGTTNSGAYHQNLDLKRVHRPCVLAIGYLPIGDKGQLWCKSVKLANKRDHMARAISEATTPVTVFADNGDVDWLRQTPDYVLAAVEYIHLDTDKPSEITTDEVKNKVNVLQQCFYQHPEYDLRSFLNPCITEDYPPALTNQKAYLWFRCLFCALAYPHKLDIKHQNIKPSNILIKNKQPNLCNFGLARGFANEILDTSCSDREQGIVVYRVPGLLPGVKRGRKADMFLLGYDNIGGVLTFQRLRCAVLCQSVPMKLAAYRYKKGDGHGGRTFAEARDLGLTKGSDRNRGDQGIGPQAGKPSIGREDDDDDDVVGFRRLSDPKYQRRTLQGDRRSFRGRTDVLKYQAGDVHSKKPKSSPPYCGLIDANAGGIVVHSPSALIVAIWQEAIARTCGGRKKLDPSPLARESAGKEGSSDNSIDAGIGGSSILCAN